MKRHGNLYPEIISFDNLYLAYTKARKGKGWQRVVQSFERDIDGNLERLQTSLLNRSFRTSEYRTKIIYEPKQRTIYILHFYPDRIVQHALMQVVAPIWDNLFINDSYACRVGKGVHRGSKKTMEYLRQNRYVLKADMAKFYPSIDHEILYQIVQRKIKCKDTLWLLKENIFSYGGGKNVPIGNYTSQWFGNLYLNELDQWIKHEWKVKHYIRYCDDFVVFHDEKSFLHQLKYEIENFISDKLKLSFSRCSVFPVSQGLDFLGYRHFRDYILLRKSTAKRVKKRLNRMPWLLKHGKINIEQYRSSIASTQGWLQWANTHNLVTSLHVAEMEQHEAV